MKGQTKLVRNLPGIAKFEVGFVGSCLGIVLRNRSEHDKHICFTIVVEDDETWYEKDVGLSSSFWMPELVEALAKASKWMTHNAVPDSVWGYKFKD